MGTNKTKTFVQTQGETPRKLPMTCNMQPTQTKEEIRKEAEQRHFHLNQEQLHPTRKKYPKKHQRSLFRTSRADAEIKVRDADERTVDKDREDKTEISADPTTMAIMAACPTGAQAPNLN